MSIIEKIRRRVEKADQQLGASAAQNRKYAQRLTRLLDRLEIEHEGRKIRTERLHLENDELRAMLLSLLLGIEAEGDLDAVLQTMETRMTALVDGAADDPAPLITLNPTIVEDPPEPVPDVAARPKTLKQALDQLIELMEATEEAPKSEVILNPVRSPAIAKALDLLRAVVSDQSPETEPVGPEPEPDQSSAPMDLSGFEADEGDTENTGAAPNDGGADPIDADELDAMEFEPVAMDDSDIDAIDFDSVSAEVPEVQEADWSAVIGSDGSKAGPKGMGPDQPEPENSIPEPEGTDPETEGTDPEPEPSDDAETSAASGDSDDADDGDPGIRKNS